ncbi:MAG TPA: hypothetical protein VGL06_23585 [Pseudonocardiaceae bacterium]|jgi:hypothetical protein
MKIDPDRQQFGELAEDLRILAIASARMLADSGERYELDDVAAECGVDLDDD